MTARAAWAAALLLGLAGCHRQAASGVTLDADADARNATAAKIDADLAAADAAARAPLPPAAARASRPPEAVERRPQAPDDAVPADTDPAVSNDDGG